MEHEESRSHQKIDQTTVSPWPNERPTPKPICPPCEQPTPRLNHPMSDPLLDQTATFRSVHHVHVTTTVTTTKWPMNQSLSLSLNLSLHLYPSLTIGFVILIFFLCVYIFWFSVIIFVWILGKCEKHDKNVFSRAFSRTQLNTRKYFPKHFLKYNQTPENAFISKKYFTLRKHFTLSQMQP